MSKPLPYKWLPGDHREMIDMTAEQRGCYRSLIDHAWEAGSFSKDPVRMASICGYSPAEDFAKEIWSVIKEHFAPATDGGFRYPGFDEQIRASKKLSKRQSERALAMWEKRRQEMPAAYRNEAEAAPKKTQVDVGGQPKMPAVRRNHTKPMPDLKTVDDAPQSVSNHEAEPMPPVYQNDAETEPKILTIPASEPDKENPVNTENVSRETSPVHAVEADQLDRYFDPLDAWEKFAPAWPQEGLIDDQASKEWFWKEIVNECVYLRLARAAERYLDSIKGWDPINFILWVDQWKAWEDPAPVKK